MIFFTSDTHFNHANIIKYCNRPWLQKGDLDGNGNWVSSRIREQRAHEMNEALIVNWNNVVSEDDIVYHLGDFAFVKTAKDLIRIRNRLNGRIAIIHGSHDKMEFWNGIHTEKNTPLLNMRLRKAVFGIDQNITLCHCKMAIWEKKHYGAWHLYGHSHGTAPEELGSLSTDIGIDCWDYAPVSLDRLVEYFKKKQEKFGAGRQRQKQRPRLVQRTGKNYT